MVVPKKRCTHWLVYYTVRTQMITPMTICRKYLTGTHEFISTCIHFVFRFLGDPIAGSILSEVSGTDPLVRIGGDFNEWLNLTSTVLIPGAVSTSNGLYICEVCLFRGTQFEECHLANTSLQVIGGPPILDFATDNSKFCLASHASTIILYNYMYVGLSYLVSLL